MVEYFIFSLLLHILIVLLFGTPTGDGSSRGQQIFGALNVTISNSLNGLLSGEAQPDRTPNPSTPRSRVTSPAARTSEPVAEVLPLRDPAPEAPVVTSATETPINAPAPSPAIEAAPEVAPVSRTPINEAAPALTREISKPVTKFVVPLPVIPAIEPLPARPALPSVDSKLQEKPTVLPPHPEILVSPKTEVLKVPPQVTAKPEATPVLQSPAPEPLAPVKPEPPIPAPAQTEPREAPAVQPMAQPPAVQAPPTPPAAPRTEAVAVPPRVEAKPLESRTLPTRALDPDIPVLPAPPREPIVLPQTERAFVPPSVETKPTALPPVPAVPLQPVTPALKPELKPAAVQPVPSQVQPPVAPTVTPAPTPLAPSVQPSIAPAATPAERGTQPPAAPATSLRPAAAASAPATGTADQGIKAQGNQPAASANSAGPRNTPGPSTGSGVDLETLRNQARDIGRQAAEGSRSGSGSGRSGVFQLQAPPVIEERKSKLAQALDKAAKADCREAYSGMGLAAVVPLVASPFRDSGCKW